MTTSYDYDAPLSEAGDPTEKLFAIRMVVSKVTNLAGRRRQYWALLLVPAQYGLPARDISLLAVGGS